MMQKKVVVLGIESSCDETAAAIVDSEGLVLSDVVHSQVALHAKYGGVVPELASRDHMRAIGPVVREALASAQCSLQELNAIAVTVRPGLIGALLVGVQMAKGLAFAAGLPIVGVDHLVGHLLAPFLRRNHEQPVPQFPFVALLASGGHTAIYRVDAPHSSSIQELGATRDDAAGEAFDKVAKLLGLGYPGGPAIDKLAQQGDATRIAFVRPMAHRKGFEFSFSGLKTQVVDWVGQHAISNTQDVADVCASFQATATSLLVDKLIAAAQAEHINDIVITGGVAANRELRRRATEAATAQGLRLTIPPFSSCTDNAAMIAYAGAQRLLRNERDDSTLDASSLTLLPRRTIRGPNRRRMQVQ